MRDLLVVGSRHDQPGEADNLAGYGAFFQSAAGESFKAHHALIDDLIFDISPQKFSIFDAANKKELSSYKLIILRGKLRDEVDAAFAISEYAALNGIISFNDYRKTRNISKVAQAVNFYLLGLPFPRTVYASPDNLLRLIKDNKFSFPFIYKSRLGAHGNNNFLITNNQDFQKYAAWGMVAQPFIENDGDYRMIIMGKEHLIIRRIAKTGSHLNNTSQGGKSELAHDLDPQIIQEGYRLAEATDMQVAGVDVIIDKATGQHYFLEINSQPQLKSGAFLAEKLQLAEKFLRNLAN